MKFIALRLLGAVSACCSAAVAAPPELSFYLPFDETLAAAAAKGDSRPEYSDGISFADGFRGKALKAEANGKFRLEYPLLNNIDLKQGTISCWVNLLNKKNRTGFYSFVAMEQPKPRVGSGAVWLWNQSGRLRGDISDIGDSYIYGDTLEPGEWAFLTMTWENGVHHVYRDGDPVSSVPNTPVLEAWDKRKPKPEHPARPDDAAKIRKFFVGGLESRYVADALIDEVRIYDGPLSPEEVRRLYAGYVPLRIHAPMYATPSAGELNCSVTNHSAEARNFRWTLQAPDGSAVSAEEAVEVPPGETRRFSLRAPERPGTYRIFNAGDPTPYGESLRIAGRENPYQASPGDLKTTPVVTIHPDEVTTDPERFLSKGTVRTGSLNGATYLEAGDNGNDRFAIRFRLPDENALYLLEYDYPDDRKRTADVIVQDVSGSGDRYEFQNGYCSGDEYRPTNRMLTRKNILFARAKDNAILFMTARSGAPAAVGEIRISKIEGGLPDAGVAPAPAVDGVTRDVGIFYEDPAVNYDFGVDLFDAEHFDRMLNRLTAYMKFSGQNLLAYPMSFYHGKIRRENDDRNHAPGFYEALMSKFDLAGLRFLPTINQHTFPEFDLKTITSESMADGSLHRSPLMIHSNGRISNGWHGTPPKFNLLHPDTQAALFKDIDEFLETGKTHPSLEGVALHVSMHNLTSLGSLNAGYNDYMIEAFEKDTGVKVPVDRKDPLRGKLYAEWLLAHAKERWIEWRCLQVAGVYRKIAGKLRKARPDLKLVVTVFSPTPRVNDPDYLNKDFVSDSLLGSGINPAHFRNDPNIILDLALYPADYRWIGGSYLRPAAEPYARLRGIDSEPETFSWIGRANSAWLHLHDRYWESDIGDPGRPYNPPQFLSAPWFRECGWRVSTLNPAGVHCMRHYILPFRFRDFTTVTKGGFLIGSHGTEEYLAPFAKAFRALPAVQFATEPGSGDTWKVRSLKHGGAFWFYAVNTDDKPVSLRIRTTAPKVTDLLTGAELDGKEFRLELQPYEFRSFRSSPEAEIITIETGEKP